MVKADPDSLQSSPSRPAHLRQTNARSVLRLIQEHSPCSKADLVRYSGLSAPTISSCVAALERIDLVQSIGDGRSNGGRPPGLLRFNSRHSYVAGVDIGGTRLRMMLADLAGAVLTDWSHVLSDRQKTPAGMCSQIEIGLKAMCHTSKVAVSRVLHLTAGAPGITDAKTGVVLSAPNLDNWDEVPLRAMLETKLGIPVVVENETNLAAVGEHLGGAARGVPDFVFIAIGTGVGAGIFVGGKLHRGAFWGAGEIGYFGVSGQPRAPMKMKEAGQLEGVIGGGGIEKRWRKALSRAGKKTSAELLQLRATQIFDLAEEGDRIARAVATETAALLSDAVADIAILLNPQIVVLGGGVGAHSELCRLTRLMLERHELAHSLVLHPSALGTQAQLRGAVFTSLEAIQPIILPQQL